jgi:hypothetical protein
MQPYQEILGSVAVGNSHRRLKQLAHHSPVLTYIALQASDIIYPYRLAMRFLHKLF